MCIRLQVLIAHMLGQRAKFETKKTHLLLQERVYGDRWHFTIASRPGLRPVAGLDHHGGAPPPSPARPLYLRPRGVSFRSRPKAPTFEPLYDTADFSGSCSAFFRQTPSHLASHSKPKKRMQPIVPSPRGPQDSSADRLPLLRRPPFLTYAFPPPALIPFSHHFYALPLLLLFLALLPLPQTRGRYLLPPLLPRLLDM